MPARQPPVFRPALIPAAPASHSGHGAGGTVFIVSCEHGGKRIPAAWRALFAGREALLASHRGYDAGALVLARDLADALHAPLFAATVSRLLVDLNRSPVNPARYSEITRALGKAERDRIHARYYQPYRRRIEHAIAQAIRRGARVVHISSHSFTPTLDGRVRNADLGLLYDPQRPDEMALCLRWMAALQHHAPALRVRRNYPYAGRADGFCSWLRRHYPAERYLGIELEMNQRHATTGGAAWPQLRAEVVAALLEAVKGERKVVGVETANEVSGPPLGHAAAPSLGRG